MSYFPLLQRKTIPFRRLVLQYCTGYSYAGILSLLSKCQHIQHLDLRRTDFLNDQHVVQLSLFMEGIGQVLRRCCKIRHLSLSELKPPRINFALTLEVLNLTSSGIDDSSLYMISKCCFGLLQLDLRNCLDVTEKGVMQVVENCTQLREINLQGCIKVAADVVDLMVFTRPSLRKITTPPNDQFSESRMKQFLCHGCFVITRGKC
ncbi:unnamed protein product [Trifolium pratense]|uniref:Uncharacterized protein n=1 Tax=Trifolium pratense TaxID=57577 RepID=A0ACB0K8Q8_TRIPR|nr:unnamed protein product [Trifolium pratense]